MSNLPVPVGDESSRKLIAAIPFPVRKRDFFRAWLALAFYHAWGRQDAFAGLIGFVFPIIAKFIPAWESAMKDLTWQIPLAIFGTLAVTRLVLSPFWLFKERDRKAVEQEGRLRDEVEKTQRLQPTLAGQIRCLAVSVNNHPSEPEGSYGDCWFTLSVNVWNEGGAGTNVTGFRFLVRWVNSGDDWPTRQIEGLDKYRARSFRPSDPGSKDRYTDDIESLFDFPIPSEITLTNSQDGWLRFVARNFPLKKDRKLDFDTVITLIALDKKGKPHTIYQGPIPPRDCPPIEPMPEARAESQLEIDFNEGQAGFIDNTSVLIGGHLTPCKLYRVSVKHRLKSTLAELKAEEVRLLSNNRIYPPLYLRIQGRDPSEKQIRLNPGTPVFWDIVEKADNDQDWGRLMHTENEREILQKIGQSTFRITASCDQDFPVTKLVTLGRKENGDLDFQLTEA